MTRDDIIRMAREAGIVRFEGGEMEAYGIGMADQFDHTRALWSFASPKNLARFAALVAAAEREAILPMLKGIDSTQTEDKDGWWETSSGADYGAGILAAIRARGETK